MTLELQTRAPAQMNRAHAHTHVGVAGAVVSAVVTMLANAQLARAARRYKSRGSPPVPPHLRRDLGLMPEVMEPRSHWEYRQSRHPLDFHQRTGLGPDSQMVLIVRDRATSRLLNPPEFDIGQLGLVGRVRLFFARRRADAMLRKVLRPYRQGSAAPLSPHLLKDIGLPPDFRMQEARTGVGASRPHQFQFIIQGAGANPASGHAMFLLKFPGRRRKPEVSQPLPPRERQKDALPPFGNITGLELMALFMSR